MLQLLDLLDHWTLQDDVVMLAAPALVRSPPSLLQKRTQITADDAHMCVRMRELCACK